MNLKEIFKPTKIKILGLILLLISMLISNYIYFNISAILFRTLESEKYLNFINSYKLNIVYWIINIILFYIIVCIIFYISKKK